MTALASHRPFFDWFGAQRKNINLSTPAVVHENANCFQKHDNVCAPHVLHPERHRVSDEYVGLLPHPAVSERASSNPKVGDFMLLGQRYQKVYDVLLDGARLTDPDTCKLLGEASGWSAMHGQQGRS